MTTLLFTHAASLNHLTPEGHPERPDRIRAVEQILAAPPFAKLVRREAPRARVEDILLVHPERHLRHLEQLSPASGLEYIDADTTMSPGTLEAAFHAVGGAVAAVDAVMKGEAHNAFCALRPPGHHAGADYAMGFCYFNQAAVAAYYARKTFGAARVAVMDFDVHHGNGTQDIFWTDADMFYGSTHQAPLYPFTGEAHEQGVGNIFNAPLSEGTGSAAFREAMRTVILPALDDFSPDLLIISAGFDAHHRDPIGGLELTEEDFAWVTLNLMDVADRKAGGRVVSLLEGGYDLRGLASSAGIHVQALMHGAANPAPTANRS
ncbi:MAG TPA: histone deacetylase family protein [Aestuariivirga sp.]|nr:histone deacetylase family protein [Aestuariivirga sp.]